MNNKGFGLQEVLVFIGISMFFLVVISLYWNQQFGSKKLYDIEPTEEVEEKQQIEDIKPVEIEIPNNYKELENKLKESSKKYSFDKTESTIISLKKLQEDNLIDNLTDPFDNSISCDGYVVYTSENEVYTPYISCNGMYTTDSFNSDFIK